jgi:hypothetical protein
MQINITEYLDKTVACFPNKTAVDDIKSSLTFAELQRQAQRKSSCFIRRKPNSISVNFGNVSCSLFLNI